MQKCADNNIFFDISLYPPTERIKEEIEELLVRLKIRFSFAEPIKEFRRRIDLSGLNGKRLILG